MPISDLLAQISGGKPQSPSAISPNAQSKPLAKRKADDDLRRDASKTARNGVPSPMVKPSQIVRPLDKPAASLPRPSTTPAVKLPSSESKRPSYANVAATKSATPSRPSAPSRPVQSSTPGTASSAAKPAPKKGSFAEIMARGQRAQAVMGQVGKIQHRKSEKRPVERREDEYAVPNGSGSRPGAKSAPSAYKGNARPGPQRNGAKAAGHVNGSRNDRGPGSARPGADSIRPGLGKKPAKGMPPAGPEPKVKKAAQATTGYTGTARPKPGKFAKKDNAPRGGALLNRNPRPSSSKHSRYEDDYYDEEMDDFIDYDDEEEEGGPRYDYASDGSSDMEAGLDELDDEERFAERQARREDIEEERLERSLKMAKEERKRKALEALRAGKRH